jgi:hypothetical protein
MLGISSLAVQVVTVKKSPAPYSWLFVPLIVCESVEDLAVRPISYFVIGSSLCGTSVRNVRFLVYSTPMLSDKVILLRYLTCHP